MLTLLGLYTLTRPSHRVIHTWKQPDDIPYDGATYYLSIVEADLDWRGFPVHVSRRYYIYVGRDSDTPVYGHTLDFSFFPFSEDIDTHIQQSAVLWSADGVTLETLSGHRLFIPQRMFTGGR